ncbi:hypothetical protein Psta_1391 [Pirellula staleyi DSM 6068]|uniref:Uncharacterized protein n=1 Tax=Pirellula staleyi (strain ATCC 27377 / DSM 6068 / ICPB 4128) TaxID=530564 RepID=D2QWW3_PIRSD|nr:hypothetical protein [Pirellula staleyi]ADB16067.1 hypothetical protein Psta_1391 [Pirellula staleyi DSM 6068]
MKQWLLIAANLVWVSSLALGWLSMEINAREQYVSISDRCHLSVRSFQIILFNRADCGPYTGGIIKFAESKYPLVSMDQGWGYWSIELKARCDPLPLRSVYYSLCWPLTLLVFAPMITGYRAAKWILYRHHSNTKKQNMASRYALVRS